MHLFNKDLVPDFVTIGKSMGNGHPVSCLITKPEYAKKFGSSGLQYFNTVKLILIYFVVFAMVLFIELDFWISIRPWFYHRKNQIVL